MDVRTTKPVEKRNKSKFGYVVYSAGETGRQAVDLLLSNDKQVFAILDKEPIDATYVGLPIQRFDNWRPPENINQLICILAFHNHYVDPKPIYRQLIALGFYRVLTMVQFARQFQFPEKYWLSSGCESQQNDKLDTLLSLFEDNKSRALLRQIFSYWNSGNIFDCPDPSLQDEYIPEDLPAYPRTLRVIDGGASNGSSLDRFRKAGYQIDSALAFEPDPENYEKLVARTKGLNVIPLPLGLWSTETQLKFFSELTNSLAAHISEIGNKLIQCVKLDSVGINFQPNLIKLDIEGAELDALIGGKHLIERYRPNLCISVYHRPNHLFAIACLIASWNLNYKLFIRCHEYNCFGLVLYCRP